MAKQKEELNLVPTQIGYAYSITSQYPSFYVTKFILFSDNTYLKEASYDREPLNDALNRMDKLILSGHKL